MKKLNLNCKVKVKLSDRGRDIYYHQFDDLIDMGIKGIKQSMPEIDKDGFSEF